VHHLDLSRAMDTPDTLHCGVQECVKVVDFRRHCLRLCQNADPSTAPSEKADGSVLGYFVRVKTGFPHAVARPRR